MSLLHTSTCFEHSCAHHQEVKIVSHSIWHHHTLQAAVRCTGALSWSVTKIILRFTVNKTSKADLCLGLDDVKHQGRGQLGCSRFLLAFLSPCCQFLEKYLQSSEDIFLTHNAYINTSSYS